MSAPPVRAPLRVAVVGAGIGGLCTAAALAGSGADVMVFDRAQDLEEVGAGLQLAPNATRLLARLGVPRHLAPGRAVGPVTRDLRRWHDGALVSRTPLGAACAALYGAPYVAVLRADLQSALLDLVGRGRVRSGHQLTGLAESADRVVLTFGNGAREEADVVVGADGIRSTVRGSLSGDEPVFSGHLVYRGLARAEDLPSAASEPRITIWLGAGQHCIAYPVAGRRAVSFAATVTAAHAPPRPSTGRAQDLAAAYAGWDPALQAVFAAAGSVGLWALYDREPLARWSTGRTTVVGDAAHPMLPFLAQGANQAVEDAVALAALLRGARATDIAPRLRRYQALRAHRTAVVARSSRRGAAELRGELRGAPQAPAPPGAGEEELRRLAWLYGYDVEQALVEGRARCGRAGCRGNPLVGALAPSTGCAG